MKNKLALKIRKYILDRGWDNPSVSDIDAWLRIQDEDNLVALNIPELSNAFIDLAPYGLVEPLCESMEF